MKKYTVKHKGHTLGIFVTVKQDAIFVFMHGTKEVRFADASDVVVYIKDAVLWFKDTVDRIEDFLKFNADIFGEQNEQDN